MRAKTEPATSESYATGDAPRALRELLLRNTAQGLFALDASDTIVAPLSPALAALFRRSDFIGVRFTDLLRPIVPKKFLNLACQHLAALRTLPRDGALNKSNPLLDLEVRFANGTGTNDLLHFAFEFTPMNIPGELGTLLVCVTDRTTALLQAREIEDLRVQSQTQSDILQTLLRLGTTRFASIVQSTDKAMNSINEILRRPAREQPAFRDKLEQTLAEVDRIGRNVAATHLGALSQAAKQFETSLLDLRGRPVLSGNDFLPLAVKLDELFVQFSLVQQLTRSIDTPRALDSVGEGDGVSRPTFAGSDRTAAPKFVAQLLERQAPATAPINVPVSAPDSASAGTLAHTLARLTENAAQEYSRSVALQCSGLDEIPSDYQSTVKNIAIQLIRNAVMHGIEQSEDREAAGKPGIGQLNLAFSTLADGSYELIFGDDGRGIDPDTVREVAISKALITPGAAIELGDRQMLKFIFKSKFTTLEHVPGEKSHGTGLAFVRRYVHDVGGLISIGSEPGRAARFKISLPPAATGAGAESDETDAAREFRG
jgi:two-component system, chemotaxis family, sensor kinase CheA